MISRRTILALLIMLLGVAVLWAWSAQHRDGCSGYFAGERSAPATEVVEMGTRQVEVPCRVWLERQPALAQVGCLGCGIVGVIFCIWLVADLQRGNRGRSRVERF